MRRCIDITRKPWRDGAAYLAGLHDLPEGSWHPQGATRRCATIILIENRLRRARGQPEIDYMSLRLDESSPQSQTSPRTGGIEG